MSTDLIIENLKKLTIEKFDISVEIVPEVRSVEDDVILLHFKIPSKYRIFYTVLINECANYVSSLHLTTWYHCTRR